ncbi:carboxypeptidase-like regulatory domain-containing protein [Pedobacter sp. B4-66]|uniref:carboxypeptidase-like regulatory domain-containing protein n=1 Tax=Pedobacter sp. B4-66 TaxID=2817280 RepID=UPI001BDA6818|nr:carboxypeptidase-like regulatory domain-containing protein [Pedobacter sp. B4-66]
MKRSKFLQLFLGITLFLSSIKASAQTVFEGQIINKKSEAPVPNVNIRLARERITVTSNAQGYFRIASADSVVKDTLIFSSVGYQTFKLLTSTYQRNGFISLVPTTTTLEEVSITNEKLKIVRLNKFDLSDIKEDPPGAKTDPFPPVVTYPFSPRNRFFAKLFTAPQGNVVLTRVDLGRRELDETKYPDKPLVTSHIKTRFLLHVMSVDPKTGAPETLLFSKIINLTDKAPWVELDLRKDNIIINSAEFYIAIEWMHIPFNEVIKLFYAPKVRKVNKKGTQILEDVSEYTTLYEPALIEYKKKKPSVSWIKNSENKWQRYDSAISEQKHEIALSATISY